jgi:hypothetical protein
MPWRASREAQSAEQVARHNAWYDRLLLDFAADPWALCEAVSGGPALWRERFVRTMHAAGLPLADDDIADRLFHFLCLRLQQIAHSETPAPSLARHYLDRLTVETPHVPTEREIAESWVLESASSPEGQRFAYGQRTKDELMQALKGDLPATFEHDDDA